MSRRRGRALPLAIALVTALVVVGNETHRWPGAPASPGGPPVGSFLADEALWAVLSANVAANG